MIVNDLNLRKIGLGGKVTNTNGYDIIFTNTADTALNHEMAYYDYTTGTLYAFVKVTATHAADFQIYMYYGNSSITTSQENITGVWSDRYVGVWHLEESAAPYLDSTSNNTDLAVESSPVQADGKIRKGIDATAGSLVDTTPSANIYQTQPTFEAWVYLDSLVTTDTPAVTIDGGFSGDGWFTLDIDSSERPFFRKSYGTGSGERHQAQSPDALSTGQWYYLVGTRPSLSTLKIYVNGTLKATATSVANALASNNSNFRIGYRDSKRWPGKIDEVRISNAERSINYIQTVYNSIANYSTYVTVDGQKPLDAGGAFLFNLINR